MFVFKESLNRQKPLNVKFLRFPLILLFDQAGIIQCPESKTALSLSLGADKFIACVVEAREKQIYIFGYEQLRPSLTDLDIIGTDGFKITQIVHPNHTGKYSICQAYINARLMLHGLSCYADYTILFDQPIASASNVFAMASIKWIPRELDDEVGYSLL